MSELLVDSPAERVICDSKSTEEVRHEIYDVTFLLTQHKKLLLTLYGGLRYGCFSKRQPMVSA